MELGGSLSSALFLSAKQPLSSSILCVRWRVITEVKDGGYEPMGPEDVMAV